MANIPEDFIHHIQLYSCTLPGYIEKDSPEAVWNCGDMDDPAVLVIADPCRDGAQLLTSFKSISGVPEEVGIKAGMNSNIKYIILQLHFGNVSVLRDDIEYDVGVVLKSLPSHSNVPVKSATTYFLGTEGTLPSKSLVRMETACVVVDSITIRLLAFTTHTHSLGLQVACYLRKANGTWYRIGITPIGNTQSSSILEMSIFEIENLGTPDTTIYAFLHRFFLITRLQFSSLITENIPPISKGDLLAARCISYNGRDYDVSVGYDTLQEMCNFYLFYYTDEGPLMESNYCYSVGPPMYSWDTDENMVDIPDWIRQDAELVNNSRYMVPHNYVGR